ncbi:16S rRNA (cytosine(1402)-N(4))-methyltransferase [Chromatium okenii]|uniref:16S rRNA (cytosine(1402)-N(4))-methyltransferase RsmH n=1 Tax=Chromatium okenii TaxID=61644 RepID=UPI001906F5E1|nr:16S rRNA (cytosine(1402)-N(4))-methyltransferase RsmH [Chromatium okenii]MBK1642359.1 16S rRNA (cytosine(1402)-N(4))-methyltransferase [Chromatium okenii]
MHLPVLLEESVTALVHNPAGCYLDATFGRGGHSRAILARLNAAGRLIACDRDPAAIAAAQTLAAADPRFSIIHSPFSALATHLSQPVDGILLDLGVSSPQLDTAERGFSFSANGPLDMRMDPSCGESAAQWLAHATQTQLIEVLRDFGEERFAKRIANAIITARLERPLLTTTQLAELVTRAVPTREPGKHPATRTFQALRIHINNELTELQQCLTQMLLQLNTNGRFVVISFHSLEDRIVKQFIRREEQGPIFPKGLPIPYTAIQGRLRALNKPIRPAPAEVAANPRARSAIMRSAERCGAA